MPRRLRTLVVEAWHLVLLVVAGGLCVAGVAAVVGYAAGKRGGHEVLTTVIAIGAAGLVVMFTGVLADPMSRFSVLTGTGNAWRSAAQQSELLHEEEHGLPPAEAARFRRDDLLYAGGVLLIGFAVLLGYICKWAGVPPANPFH